MDLEGYNIGSNLLDSVQFGAARSDGQEYFAKGMTHIATPSNG